MGIDLDNNLYCIWYENETGERFVPDLMGAMPVDWWPCRRESRGMTEHEREWLATYRAALTGLYASSTFSKRLPPEVSPPEAIHRLAQIAAETAHGALSVGFEKEGLFLFVKPEAQS